MKKILIALLVFFASFACISQNETKVVEVISAEDFQKGIQSEKDIQLIDVRTSGEYEKGNIKNSKLLDYSNGDFEKSIASLDKNKAVYIYCASGNRSGKAASILEKEGFKKVYDLKGGYNNWPYK